MLSKVESIFRLLATCAILHFLFKYEFEVNAWSRGLIAGFFKNGIFYIVTTAGRSSNVLNIFRRNIRGGSQWLYRYDRPHKNVRYSHLNINRDVTGVRDPHTPISKAEMFIAQHFGMFYEAVSMVVFEVFFAFVVYDVYTLKEGTLLSEYLYGFFISLVGSALGDNAMPGVGTLIGGLVGGACGGIYGKTA